MGTNRVLSGSYLSVLYKLGFDETFLSTPLRFPHKTVEPILTAVITSDQPIEVVWTWNKMIYWFSGAVPASNSRKGSRKQVHHYLSKFFITRLHYVESSQNSFKIEKIVFEYFWVEYLFLHDSSFHFRGHTQILTKSNYFWAFKWLLPIDFYCSWRKTSFRSISPKIKTPLCS